MNYRTSRRNFLFVSLLFLTFMITAPAVPAKAVAGLILDAELRFTYEDNVVGLLSDQQTAGSGGGSAGGMMTARAIGMGGMGIGRHSAAGTGGAGSPSSGDFSTTLSAEAGGYRNIMGNASLYAKVFASQTSFDTYSDFDVTTGGVGAGVGAVLGRVLSANAFLFGKVKRFGESLRDSTAYGGKLSLKERLTSRFWLREAAILERNRADISVFSYNGVTLGISAGYNITGKTLVSAGYSVVDQQYDDPGGAELRTDILFLSTEYAFTASWSVGGEYDLQTSRANAAETGAAGASATNNVFSIALRYGY